MNVSLTQELEKFIQDKVTSGLYTSASEVVRESLRLMRTFDEVQHQRIGQLNRAIDMGLNDLVGDKKISAEESYARLKDQIDRKK